MFRTDLSLLIQRLCEDEAENIKEELNNLKKRLVFLNEQNLVKINHSVMELVCAKNLVLDGYKVNLENSLNGISCDIYAYNGFGNMIVEVETGFVSPKNALNPFSYIISRIASKISRYSNFAKKFALAVPPYYQLPIHQALTREPEDRNSDEIDEIKTLCDQYYSNPPVRLDEIKKARIHQIYIVDVDNGVVSRIDPEIYSNKISSWYF